LYGNRIIKILDVNHICGVRNITVRTFLIGVAYVARLVTRIYFVSSPNSGERSPDIEKEALVITEPVGYPVDDFDLVVDALEHTGVQRIAAVRQQSRQVVA